MKETPFQEWVIDVARRTGWSVWHVPYPVRAVGGGRFVPEQRAAGLPDLILMHPNPPRLIFAELKGDGGDLTYEQHRFLGLARAVAASIHAVDPDSVAFGVYVWRPGIEALIEETLKSRVLVR